MGWLDKLGEYAPHIVSAIASGGATLPSLALKAVGDALGTDIKDESELSTAVQNATPEQLLKIKSADYNFKLEMQRLANDLEYAEISDVQHAREQHKHSPMPAIICCALTVVVAGIAYSLLNHEIPKTNGEILYMLIGQVITAWIGSVAYWIGTTRSSASKTVMMSKSK